MILYKHKKKEGLFYLHKTDDGYESEDYLTGVRKKMNTCWKVRDFIKVYETKEGKSDKIKD